MVNKYANWFIWTAAAVLTVTGIAKASGAFGSAQVLGTADPLFGLPFRHLMLLVSAVELFIACLCFCVKKRPVLKIALIAWIASSFLVYRLGLWWLDWKHPCSCLGKLTDTLHISPHSADNLIKVLLAYLLIGSYGLLLNQWRKTRQVLFEAKNEKGHA